MKISNQLKVGVLTLVTIALAVFGYNFLKGKEIFGQRKMYYAKFKDIGELTISSPVRIKGYPVGTVASISESDADLDEIVVGIEIKKNINIGTASLAFVKTTVLGASSIEIKLIKSAVNYKLGDTLATSADPKFLEEIQQKINPIMGKVDNSLGHLDELMVNANSIIDQNVKDNLKLSLSNVAKLTLQLTQTTENLKQLLANQENAITATMNNAKTFSGNLNNNNANLNAIVENLKATSQNFKNLNLEPTLAKASTAIDELTVTLKNVNNPNGSVGKLLNDKLLYDRLNNTVRSVNVLIDDLKTNPKRYVNISIFGKKNKGNALTAPIVNADSSLIKN